MEIKYADFLSASNIYNEVMRELQVDQKLQDIHDRSYFNKIMKNCNKLIVERFADIQKQDLIRFYITQILLPIHKNDLKKCKPVTAVN